jgi:hypothetical protein
MIHTELIERAIALMKKNKSHYQELAWYDDWWDYPTKFTYPKFFAFLLSPEFVETYASLDLKNPDDSYRKWIAQKFWQTIYEYQSWNEQPLISLLSKI